MIKIAVIATCLFIAWPAWSVIISHAPNITDEREKLLQVSLSNNQLYQAYAADSVNIDLTSLLELIQGGDYVIAKKQVQESEVNDHLKHYLSGLISLAEGDRPSARESFTAATQTNHSVPYAHYALALLNYEEGNTEQALVQVREFNAQDHSYVSSLMLQARLEQKLSLESHMVNTLKKAIHISSDNIRPTSALVKHLFRNGKIEEAGEWITRFNQTYPNHREGLSLATSYHLSRGDETEARRALTRWMEHFENDRTPRLQLIEVLIAKNEFSQAEQYLDESARRFPDEAEFRFLRAQLYTQTGRETKAREILMELTRAGTEFMSKEKAQQLLESL